ncbi:MAG: DUF72 domain-containing protein [Candidatus Binataceae bacterium]
MGAQIRIGTSGFSYKEWLGGFYPPKLPGTKMLEHYAATRLAAVEINYTFRSMPKRTMLEKWASQTPARFRFALKAPQRITHFARLRGVEDATRHFADVASALDERLGPALFQLPPDFKRDVPLLTEFLALIRHTLRAAFEFRSTSWFDDSTLQALRDGGAALCINESEKIQSPIERTAPYVYLRLRREDYDDQGLKTWAECISRLADDAEEIYVFFKHAQHAPELALKLRAMLDGSI